MVKITENKLKLLTDINIKLFIESGIRGDIKSLKRYGKANNLYMES